jgi:hypothetical protein
LYPKQKSYIFDLQSNIIYGMENKVKTFLLLFLYMISYHMEGQVNTTSGNVLDDRFRGIIYRKELTFDIRLHNNGFALAYNIGDIKTFYRTNYYHYELGMLKDEQEYSQNKNIVIVSGPLPKKFRYGKQNNLFIARAGRGTKRYITDKAKRKGVSIGYTYEVGPSLALLKPYYLDVLNKELVNGELKIKRESIKYGEDTKDRFLNYDNIYGSSGFSKGLTELNFTPGVQSKIAMFFSVGVFDKYVKAGEVGIMGDLFIKKVPIMVETETQRNSPYFLNLYVNLQFGRRSN